eukprot:scaffold126769_cov18-Tisochrysis_lutea.AAC.1
MGHRPPAAAPLDLWKACRRSRNGRGFIGPLPTPTAVPASPVALAIVQGPAALSVQRKCSPQRASC